MSHTLSTSLGTRPRQIGVLVDTGRHFLPVALIRRTIDGLGYSKMNVEGGTSSLCADKSKLVL